jgi:hypothetical protein
MVQFYVDDPGNVFLVRTINDVPAGMAWDFNHPFFLLLNLAVGGTGSWPGPPDSTTPSPALMSVDYVRWYKPAQIAGPTMSAAAINMKAGMTGSTALSLSSAIGTGRVYLSCTTTAPNASCSINSGDSLNQYTVDFSKSANGNATVSVTTAGPSGLANVPARESSTPVFSAFALSLAGFMFAAFAFAPAKWGRILRDCLAIAGMMLVLMAPGCGGSKSAPNTSLSGSGNYSVTVKAYTVSNFNGNPDSTVSIPLTIN